jgi:hypothetical protein
MLKRGCLFLISLAGLFANAAHAEQFSVALFTKTAGWHHESIIEGVDRDPPPRRAARLQRVLDRGRHARVQGRGAQEVQGW